MGYPVQNIWIVDNHIHANGGDSVQVSHNANYTAHHVYIGRNHMHDDGENAVDVKQADDVIISQNVMHGYEPSGGSSGPAMVAHYGPHRVWVLYNHVFDATIGIISTSCDPFYVIGNVVHDIEDRGIDFRGAGTIHVVGNTISRAAVGIHGDNGPSAAHVVNNIIAEITDPSGFHIQYDNGLAGLSEMYNNLFYQGGDPLQISWGNADAGTIAELQTLTGKGAGSIEGDPDFVDADGADGVAGTADDDFRLNVGSPAIDAGAVNLPDTNLPAVGNGNDVYEFFSIQYPGLSILFDPDWVTVPTSSGRDIGAYAQ